MTQESKMSIRELIKNRHSVRQFSDRPVAEESRRVLEDLVGEINEESGLHIQIVWDEADCFRSFMASFGRFSNVNNYIALVGDKSMDRLDELAGYYGEKLVLCAQGLWLNTCWVGGTFSKGACRADIGREEKLVLVIALGYGTDQGKMHKTRPMSQFTDLAPEDMPVWFKNGMIAAMYAPTAMNQQKFWIRKEGDEAVLTPKMGLFTRVDAGIVRYHFEVASGHRVRVED